MAPSKQAKKEAAKLELPEDEERFPRLNDTNRSEYEIVAEIHNDLQAMVDQGVLGPHEPVEVARNVFIPHRQGTHKTTGDRLILLWYGYLAPHKKGHMQLTPEGQNKITSQRLLDQSQAGVYRGKCHIPPHFGLFGPIRVPYPKGLNC